MFIRQLRSTFVAAGAAVLLMTTGCGDSPDPDAPVEPEDRTQVDTPIDGDEVPQADIPQNLDPDLTDTIPGAPPGPGPEPSDERIGGQLPPGTTTTIVGGDLPPP
jgi:hypothetical protein